jgi:acetyl esterase/lipase
MLPTVCVPVGSMLYLHGGGYIGTSPAMYAVFTAALAQEANVDVFVPDYRLAPEFPFPAGVLDALDVYRALLDHHRSADRLLVGGDSGGGGLATSLLHELGRVGLPAPGALVLFSPEVDLVLTGASVRENAGSDILPWNIPTAPYLHGEHPDDPLVCANCADVSGYPPTFVAYGGDEMFRDPIRHFVGHLEVAEVPVRAMEEPGVFHVFPIVLPWTAASQRVRDGLREFAADYLPPSEEERAEPPVPGNDADGQAGPSSS